MWGCREIPSYTIPDSDLFFGEAGNFEHIPPYDENGNLAPPGWSYLIEQGGDSDWDKGGETLCVKIKPSGLPVSGKKYFIKFNTYNGGVSEEAYFTV